MTIQSYSFRATQAGGTGFPGDAAPNNTALYNPFPTYTDALGYGFSAAPSSYTNINNAVDGRLAGYVGISSSTFTFKLNLPNGQFKIWLGMGSNSGTASHGARLKYGPGANDYVEVNSASAVPVGSTCDATGAVVTDAAWVSNTDSKTNYLLVTITGGSGLTITKSTANQNNLKYVAFEVVPGPLQPTRLDNDETNISISGTGTTTVGSPSVTLGAATPGISPGMSVYGPAIPAGATVASVTLDTSRNVTAVALASGSGVTAVSGGALRFAWAPSLGEKNPPGKLIAPIAVPLGANSLAVTNQDGTPHQSLIIRMVNGVPWLAYGLVPFPGTGPTHTFNIDQTDNSGSYTGSPYRTTFTLPVALAPTKPTDGTSLLSRISTGAFLARQNILTKMAVSQWQGYLGQTFNGGDYLATSLADMWAQAATYSGQAAPGKWFRIRLPAGLWATDFANQNLCVDFQPFAGGGLLIEPDATSPLIKGNSYVGNLRGVHIRGVTFCGENGVNTGVSLRLQYKAGNPLTVCVISGCKFGYLQNPANSEANFFDGSGTPVPSELNKFQDGIWCTGASVPGGVTGGADQLTVIGCDFYGMNVSVLPQGVRNLDCAWNANRFSVNDLFAVASVDSVNFGAQFTGFAPNDMDAYQRIHNNILYDQCDNIKGYSFDANDVWSGPHGDFLQTRGLTNATTTWRLFERNILVQSVTGFATNPNSTKSTTQRFYIGRQFVIENQDVTVNAVYLECISCTSQIRGIEFTNGESYIEYCTLAAPPKMPQSSANTSDTALTVKPTVVVSKLSYTGRRRVRKTIFEDGPVKVAVGNDPTRGICTEDCAPVVFSSNIGPSPGTVLTGPYYADPSDTARSTRMIFDVADNGTVRPNGMRKGLWSPLLPKPGADMGAQSIMARIPAGDSDTLTSIQAATLMAVTAGQPSGSLPGKVSLRWNSGAGETGSQTGSDVTFSVQ